MCWHLSIAVPSDAVEQLHRELPAIAPARPELDAEVVAAIASGGKCFFLGIQCSCDLFRLKRASATQRIRKRAKREHWSDAKLHRALKDTTDDWSGLHPEVRAVLSGIAEQVGKVSVFVYWEGRGGSSDVREQRQVDPETLRRDWSIVAENRLLIVRKSA